MSLFLSQLELVSRLFLLEFIQRLRLWLFASWWVHSKPEFVASLQTLTGIIGCEVIVVVLLFDYAIFSNWVGIISLLLTPKRLQFVGNAIFFYRIFLVVLKAFFINDLLSNWILLVPLRLVSEGPWDMSFAAASFAATPQSWLRNWTRTRFDEVLFNNGLLFRYKVREISWVFFFDGWIIADSFLLLALFVAAWPISRVCLVCS